LLSQNYERELEERVRERTAQLKQREEETVLRLMSAMDYQDDETGSHARRLGLYSSVVAEALGWNSDTVDTIRLAAPIHDLGKIGIPDGILQKPGPLNPQELKVMQNHSEIGASILGNTEVPMLQMARDIALSHHERWDGSGYPNKLMGDEIPECVRIVGIVDVYDALVHDRVYRPALPEEKALLIMNEEYENKKYDPRVFQCFADLLPELRRIREEVADDCHPSDSDRGLQILDPVNQMTSFHAVASGQN
jgi:cyclic di-GMP phosphodiesterase